MTLYPEILGRRGRSQTNYKIQMDGARAGLMLLRQQVEAGVVVGEDLAGVQTITIAGGAGNYVATLQGESTPAVAFDTDDTTTATALRDAIRELDAAANFVIDSAAGVITVTSRFAGAPFTLAVTGTGATAAETQAPVVSRPITIGTLVRIANGQDNELLLPADSGDTNWGLAGAQTNSQLNYFNNDNSRGLFIVERGQRVSVLREGTGYGIFETPAQPQGGVLYRNAVDGANDILGAFNVNAGAGLVAPSDMSLRLLRDTIPLDNGLNVGLIEFKL